MKKQLTHSRILQACITAGLLTGINSIATAALITEADKTFTVSSNPESISDMSFGTTYHSRTESDPNPGEPLPPGVGDRISKAQVGRYGFEGRRTETRGLSEFDLGGLTRGSFFEDIVLSDGSEAVDEFAYLTFDVYNEGGLFADIAPGFASGNDFRFLGEIAIELYIGDGDENVSDYGGPEGPDYNPPELISEVTRFSTASLFEGGILSFNITDSIFDTSTGDDPDSADPNDVPLSIFTDPGALGVRLRADPRNDAGAWTFNEFRLTSTDETTRIPEPATLALLGIGLLGLGWFRHRPSA